ncbi:MAG TPA: NYN domain-containing protein, partial [Chloroflexota bacterium]|nr:NYN domain-containing protein [Chloroflexota bacterium]
MASDRDDRRGNIAAGPVGLFIDWDNFAIGLRQEMPDRAADVGPILRWARRFGPLTVCRAYGEWRDPGERLAIYNAGVEVVYAPVLPLSGSLLARNGGGAKSLADTAMAVDVTDLLNLMPSLSTIVLATSDKDLIPVLRFAQRRGLQAVVVGSDRTAAALKDLADEFISYRQLLDQESGGVGALSRPATVPPIRYPRPARPGTPAIGVSELPAALPAPSTTSVGRSGPGRA